MTKWRVGRKVPINVYEGDRPVCQCHTVEDAKRIVAAVNAMPADGYQGFFSTFEKQAEETKKRRKR